MPVYQYLDLSTAHVTHDEWQAITDGLIDLEDGPRVIKHDYGAWVNVPDVDPAGPLSADDQLDLAVQYPNLDRCLTRAREQGCNWMNFDQDAAEEPDLPRFEW